MKKNLFLPILIICCTSCGQYVNFETTIHQENATKDGIYIDDYVVNIDSDRISQLDNKKVRIKGKYTIIKGVDSTDGVIEQGRTEDAKHILRPKIKVID